jgi:hypothetical protein
MRRGASWGNMAGENERAAFIEYWRNILQYEWEVDLIISIYS